MFWIIPARITPPQFIGVVGPGVLRADVAIALRLLDRTFPDFPGLVLRPLNARDLVLALASVRLPGLATETAVLVIDRGLVTAILVPHTLSRCCRNFCLVCLATALSGVTADGIKALPGGDGTLLGTVLVLPRQ